MKATVAAQMVMVGKSVLGTVFRGPVKVSVLELKADYVLSGASALEPPELHSFPCCFGGSTVRRGWCVNPPIQTLLPVDHT